jgi:hypothetical protein
MGIEEEEEVEEKGICNIFNKIIAESFPNLKKRNTHSVISRKPPEY